MRRRDFLVGAAAASLGPAGVARAMASGGPKRLIVVLAYGGWDPTYCFDPKMGATDIEGPEWFTDPNDPADVEVVETVSGIPLALNDGRRPSVRRFFQNRGADAVVVNGVYTASIVHEPCKIRMLTGSRRTDAPDVSVIVGKEHGTGPLGSIDMTGRGQAGSLAVTVGTLGKYNQVKGLLDPRTLPPAPALLGIDYPQLATTAQDDVAIAAHLRARAERYARLRPHATGSVDQLIEAWDRADAWLDHPAFAGKLTGTTQPILRDQIGLAVTAFTEGIAQAVLLDDRLDYWDTHPDNESQNTKFDDLFSDLDLLADVLTDAGLYDDTRILVLSEMGRTPRHNAKSGKDHWPYTSALFYGGGVRGGRVIGATDDQLLGRPVDLVTGELASSGDPCRFDNLAAGVLHAMDVDPEAWLPGVAPLSALV